MAVPTYKALGIERTINSLFGTNRAESIKANKCTLCCKPATKFTDVLSEREFRISGMCQVCQDGTFGPPKTI